MTITSAIRCEGGTRVLADRIFCSAPSRTHTWPVSALLAAGKSALAVADGEGRNSVWLALQGLLVDAFVISPVGVAKADELACRTGVSVSMPAPLP